MESESDAVVSFLWFSRGAKLMREILCVLLWCGASRFNSCEM